MKQLFFLIVFACSFQTAKAQLYYPPLVGSTWETTDPATLGWCEDSINSLYDYLEQTNSKAFIVLKNGKIVLEKYFGTFTVDSLWLWNSAGKTLTGFAVGIAQEEGYLSVGDTTSDYLGTGWTNMSLAQEEKITIRHQLSMTTGLADTGNIFCTDPTCLNYMADPGTRWAYHNGPYTLLDGVIENATGLTLNQWVTQKIKTPTGMTGLFVPIDYNNIFVSNARSMARFGLLLHSEGIWNGTPVLDDPTYFQEMTTSSQAINPSYGYLTWLNGQSSFMLPQSQFSFPGSPLSQAPADLFSALGKNGQIINIAPSEGLVVVRMGEADGVSLVPVQYNDSIWARINRLSCPASLDESSLSFITVSPNPVSGNFVQLEGITDDDEVALTTLNGKQLTTTLSNKQLELPQLAPGVYLITINRFGEQKTIRLLVN
ncbi:MAG: serine hydrolase [Candidatus Fluviicola riflensis]|nr:MAG: serine hydrolase [Candidatus Fluviicola riflensis]OGS75928.1 MAG: serine hydrolase [Candidatus Fluviicola riflensis]OGS83608.1 MAG: serine hydrolase [Fluviicola sp. RIFCSPHIGHO2_01_FULL_43_53]OGS85747.1 MAG: serine hydrolase [Fluviicola sp. RIFCSPHIGHO2_12_FULL_43_24]